MDERVIGDVVLEGSLLLARRQFAIKQEVAHLDEIALFGQILDGISTMAQYSLVAVDEGDLGIAASSRRIAGIEGEVTGLTVQPLDVDHSRALGAPQNIQLVALARAVIDKRDAVRLVRPVGAQFRVCLGHARSPPYDTRS
jgi:hypothetical protein